MQRPEKPHPTVQPASGVTSPAEPEVATPSGFDPVARVYRADWAVSHANVHRTAALPPAVDADVSSVERQPFAEDGTRLIRTRAPRSATSPQDVAGSTPVSDGLTLDRLYARFDAIARGWVNGDSTNAHRSVVERLAANQSNAVELGWSNFLVARRGGTGRLELLGSRVPGQARELVPDQIPRR